MYQLVQVNVQVQSTATYTIVHRKEFRQDTRQKLDLSRRSDDKVVDVATRVDAVFDTLEDRV